MNEVALLMSVGPAELELLRMRDFFAALWHWESAVKTVVLIDDHLKGRDLERWVSPPTGVRVQSIQHPRRGMGSGVWGGLTEGILLGLEWIATHAAMELVLKIDTDALVIAPFAEKAEAFLQKRPNVGLIGLYDQHATGKPRHYRPWDRAMIHHALPIGWQRLASPSGRRIRWQLFGRAGELRRVLWQARRRNYQWGEHCNGGAYILRGAALREVHDKGYLRHPDFWRRTLVSEDVVVALYTKVAGWDLAGCASEGEIFGIAHKGLPLPLTELVTKCYSIVHSVKNDCEYSEEQIRGFFNARRHTPSAA